MGKFLFFIAFLIDFIKLKDWVFHDNSKLTLFYSKDRTLKLRAEN